MIQLFYSDLAPAPPVGFNLTFICTEGKVFNHDWFATPFIMMTCQVILSEKNTTKYFTIASCSRMMDHLINQTGIPMNVSFVSFTKQRQKYVRSETNTCSNNYRML